MKILKKNLKYLLFFTLSIFNSLQSISVYKLWEDWYSEVKLQPKSLSFAKLGEIIKEAIFIEISKKIFKEFFAIEELNEYRAPIIQALRFLYYQEQRLAIESQIYCPLIASPCTQAFIELKDLFLHALPILRTFKNNKNYSSKFQLANKISPELLQQGSLALPSQEEASIILCLIKNYFDESYDSIVLLIDKIFREKAKDLVEENIGGDFSDASNPNGVGGCLKKAAHLNTLFNLILDLDPQQQRFPTIVNYSVFNKHSNGEFENSLQKDYFLFHILSKNILLSLKYFEGEQCFLLMIQFWIYKLTQKKGRPSNHYSFDSKIEFLFTNNIENIRIADKNLIQKEVSQEEAALGESESSFVIPFGSGYSFPNASHLFIKQPGFPDDKPAVEGEKQSCWSWICFKKNCKKQKPIFVWKKNFKK